MIYKLSFRNVRRMAKEYQIYFITMMLITALMYAFNTLIFSKDIQLDENGVLQIMTGIATFFIVLVVAWLINYMVLFTLEKRSREFAIYLLTGMKKKEISRLYFLENVMFGIGAFFVGLVLGALFQQILISIFTQIMNIGYHFYLGYDCRCIYMTAACYVGCYLLALLRCRKKFNKMNIYDLMNAQKQNEVLKGKHEQIKKILFPLSLLFFSAFGVFLFGFKKWDTGVLCIFLIGLVITIYLFYIGISAWISSYVKKRGKVVYCRDGLFLLRQFSSKIRTLSFTMGTLTALFTLALLGSSVAVMFIHFQNEILVDKFPFDIQIHSENINEGFQQELSVLKDETDLNKIYTYKVYENGTNQVNTYLYTHLKEFGDYYINADGTPDYEKINDALEMTYYKYDTYIAVSDYNQLRKMLGFSEISLKEDEYAIHMKKRVFDQVGDLSNQISIKHKEIRLSFAGSYTESFSQDGHNGGDYILIVPDKVIQNFCPYYSELVADINGIAPQNLSKKLDALDEAQADILSDSENLPNNEEVKFCSGSDTIVVYMAKNLVRDNVIQEVKYTLISIIFPLLYIGMVFFCIGLTVLSVQQLSDSVKYRFRYQILLQIGYSKKEIEKMVLKQLSAYYLCPALIAFLISGLIAGYAGNRFDFYTGIHSFPATYFFVAATFFMAVYMIYFMMTYRSFKNNIYQKSCI